MQIVKLGTETLREKSRPIQEVTEEIKALAAEMLSTMYREEGVGLAAPQIGKNIRMFVVDDGSGPRVFINPQITGMSRELVEMEEGCLSIPGVYEKVVRPAEVRIQSQNENGRREITEATGFLARIIQHEYDHLEGVLFIDKIGETKKERIEKKFQKKKEKESSRNKKNSPA